VTFEGYTGVEPTPDPKLVVVTRLTDFSSPFCNRPAVEVASRLPFKGQAIQKFMVTQQEGHVLHQGR